MPNGNRPCPRRRPATGAHQAWNGTSVAGRFGRPVKRYTVAGLTGAAAEEVHAGITSASHCDGARLTGRAGGTRHHLGARPRGQTGLVRQPVSRFGSTCKGELVSLS